MYSDDFSVRMQTLLGDWVTHQHIYGHIMNFLTSSSTYLYQNLLFIFPPTF